jgi:hypothetical protein
MMDPWVKPARDRRCYRVKARRSAEQVARRIERNEADALFAQVFGGSLQPIDERCAETARTDCITDPPFLIVMSSNRMTFVSGLKFPSILGPMVFFSARNRAQLQAADRVDVPLILQQIEHDFGENDFGNEICPLRVDLK